MILRTSITAVLLALFLLTLAGCDNMSTQKSVVKPQDDTSLNLTITEALQRDSLFAHSNIAVTSSKGQVKLNGTTASMEDKNRATDIVKNINGVVGVQNNLQVVTPPPATNVN
ncbi:BON domain-containing protein [Rheinheimera metallidurans]|uniref:BON domain-containing protein n=1 Tax=Rheinheimera metallidurans TaxID=2925781 RepID=UPI0030035910